MKNYIIGAHLSARFVIIFMLIAAFAGNGYAEELKFGDWECIEETDPTKDEKSKKIGTFAKDGVSSLWVSESDLGQNTVLLTLKSKNVIDSEHITYWVDSSRALTLSTAMRTCESYCLTESVTGNGEVIKAMAKGYRMMFEYSSYPDITNKPIFSLLGFTRAYNWFMKE
ncbi:MAG: hypothetical protein PVF56_19725 [Desulfobacterales bacterium]|jgi:hypothetical protein